MLHLFDLFVLIDLFCISSRHRGHFGHNNLYTLNTTLLFFIVQCLFVSNEVFFLSLPCDRTGGDFPRKTTWTACSVVSGG